MSLFLYCRSEMTSFKAILSQSRSFNVIFSRFKHVLTVIDLKVLQTKKAHQMMSLSLFGGAGGT